MGFRGASWSKVSVALLMICALIDVHLCLAGGNAGITDRKWEKLSIDDAPTKITISSGSIRDKLVSTRSIGSIEDWISVEGLEVRRGGFQVRASKDAIREPIHVLVEEKEKVERMYDNLKVVHVDRSGLNYIKLNGVNTRIPGTVFYGEYLNKVAKRWDFNMAVEVYATYRGYWGADIVRRLEDAYKISGLPLKNLLPDTTALALDTVVEGRRVPMNVLTYACRGNKVVASLYTFESEVLDQKSAGEKAPKRMQTLHNKYHHVSECIDDEKILNTIYLFLAKKIYELVGDRPQMKQVKLEFYPKTGIRIDDADLCIKTTHTCDEKKTDTRDYDLGELLNMAYKKVVHRDSSACEDLKIEFLSVALFKDGVQINDFSPPKNENKDKFVIDLKEVFMEIDSYVNSRASEVETFLMDIRRKNEEILGKDAIIRTRFYSDFLPKFHIMNLFGVKQNEIARKASMAQGGLLMNNWDISVMDPKMHWARSDRRIPTYNDNGRDLAPSDIVASVVKEGKTEEKLLEILSGGSGPLEKLEKITDEEKKEFAEKSLELLKREGQDKDVREFLKSKEAEELIEKLTMLEEANKKRVLDKEKKERALARLFSEIQSTMLRLSKKEFEKLKEEEEKVKRALDSAMKFSGETERHTNPDDVSSELSELQTVIRIAERNIAAIIQKEVLEAKAKADAEETQANAPAEEGAGDAEGDKHEYKEESKDKPGEDVVLNGDDFRAKDDVSVPMKEDL